MRLARRRLPVGIALLCVAALTGPAYAAGDTAGAAAPGEVISAQQMTVYADAAKLVAAPVAAWKVLYGSTSATGEAIAVSGAILVPKTAWTGPGERPIIGYSVGTHGMGDQCAPSYELGQGTETEFRTMNLLLQQGWAVAVTDYENLGTPGTHTYVVGRSEGHVALDVVRAAAHTPGSGLSASAPVGLWGYSQGGQSTGWAAQYAARYAPELHVKAAAAGGVPADFLRISRSADGGPAAGLVLDSYLGYDAAYPALQLEKYLNDAGRAAMTDLQDDCVTDAVARYALRPISDFTTSAPLDTAAWQARFDDNRLGGTAKPSMPVYLYHGLVDEVVPYDQAAQLRREWCANGATVTWAAYPGEHLTAYEEAAPVAALWMRSRLAGEATSGTCGLL
jgi:hypothetical protein